MTTTIMPYSGAEINDEERGPLTRRERAELRGMDWGTVIALHVSGARAEHRCRVREISAKGGSTTTYLADRIAQWLGASVSTDVYHATLQATPVMAADEIEEAMEIRADVHAMMMVDDSPVAVSADRIADGIMADLCLSCDEDGWSRGYNRRYTDTMRHRDYHSMTRMAIRMGLIAMGPIESKMPMNGAPYGADTLDDMVAVSLGVLWDLLAGYRHGTRSPRAWVRTWFFRRLESVRRDLHAERDPLHLASVPTDEIDETIASSETDEAMRIWMVDVLGEAKGRLAQCHIVEGLTLPEAAARVGITTKCAENWWYRGTTIPDRLRAALAETEAV